MNINDISIGSTLTIHPETLNTKREYEGTVIYIHPMRRFYTVEYELDNGYKLRESFEFPRKPVPRIVLS